MGCARMLKFIHNVDYTSEYWLSLNLLLENDKALCLYLKELHKQRKSELTERKVEDYNGFIGVLNPIGLGKLSGPIATIYLTAESLSHIREWYKGGISGKRCLKNILDSTVAVGGAFAGAAVGGTIGSLFGPVGTIIGKRYGFIDR